MMRKFLTLATRQLHVISRETVKPASQTPPHLKCYKLSSMDQFTPRIYMPMVFFFPNYGLDTQRNPSEKSRCLKNSLAETLTKYYPLAGRLVSGVCVDCNDEGVEVLEAQIECAMSEILENLEHGGEVDQVFPSGFVLGQDPYKGSTLVVVQLNHFNCGGLAIAVCMSHKIGDACTLCNFLTFWAARTRLSGEEASPHFISWPSDDSTSVPETILNGERFVIRRFVFPNSKIAQLKAIATDNGVHTSYSRVQVLSALLYKCAMDTARANSGLFRPSVLFLALNMRPKMVPPLPATSFGNLYGRITIPTRTEREMKLNTLTDQIKNGMMQQRSVEKLDVNEYLSTLRESLTNNPDAYMSSSLCRFPFYQLDFGWGKPTRVILGSFASRNMFVLMDTPSGDGIEAMVGLEEQGMSKFECNKEILAFAS